MKNLNLFYIAAFAFTSALATAQQGVNQTPVFAGQISTKREASQKATGSKFLNEKFMPARISDSDKTVLARYNAYADNFEINDPIEGTEKVLTPQADVTITFTSTGEVYTLKEYKNEKEENKRGYLNVISDNPNVKIYKREGIFLQAEVFPANSYQTYKPAAYKKSENEFYINVKGGETVFFSGKKDLAKLVPTKSKELLDFIKQNKLDVEKEADLEKIGAYLQSII